MLCSWFRVTRSLSRDVSLNTLHNNFTFQQFSVKCQQFEFAVETKNLWYRPHFIGSHVNNSVGIIKMEEAFVWFNRSPFHVQCAVFCLEK